VLALLALLVSASCAPEEREPASFDEIRSSDSLPNAPPTRLLMADPPNGALAIGEIASADVRESWEANVLFDTLVSDSAALGLLREYGALPYAVFGLTAWDHRLGGGPAAASEVWVAALRRSAARRAESVLCDERPLPGARQREATALLEALAAGQPILYALRVRAPAGELRRMASDPRLARLEPAAHMEGGLPVLPEVEPPPWWEGPELPPRPSRTGGSSSPSPGRGCS
jgi:hypothetical protein